MKRAIFSILSMLLGLGVALLAIELWANRQPIPRIQQVLMVGTQTEVVDGVALWRSVGTAERENFACEGEQRLMVLGSSILFGSDLEPEESLGPLLESHRPGLCVHNLAQPGFTLQNQLTAAQKALSGPLAGRTPDVLLLEMWANSPNILRLVGQRAYNFGDLQVDEQGFPNPFGLPTSANRTLFGASAGYRFVVLSRAPLRRRSSTVEEWRGFARGRLQEALALAAAHEMTLVVVYMPTLSQPFAESAAHPLASYGPARHAFAAVDAVQVDAAALLTDASYEALRLDPCCHYNAAGMALLAARLVDVLPAP